MFQVLNDIHRVKTAYVWGNGKERVAGDGSRKVKTRKCSILKLFVCLHLIVMSNWEPHIVFK